ncbi:hypothetical protein B0J11DRAFT_603180 [Dendryphion nanum]|uniref:Rhodopsin domain-containing protein n=1 Tax=Dendryphion nanum TaxID=256645 RepID=A0A9P9E6D7_9PLEO|nr:hypothetical protein B0J11DRAFT_603180 [Dendryphion nanum]
MWLETRDATGYSTPKVSPGAFIGIIWAMTTFSLLFLPARLYARFKTARRFYWDDFFVVFAWILLLAITASCTAFNSVTYDIMAIGAGKKKFPPNVRVITMQFSRLFTIIPMIFYAGLWSIKIAFLLFFRRLGTQSIHSLNRHWWIVFCITMVLVSAQCQASQGLSFISMKVNVVLDVFTDLLIMTIPFNILRRVRLSLRQRIFLSGIFSLVVITITFAIVRAVITTVNVKNQMDPIWMYLWTNIELSIAIIIACVAPYRSLFLRDRRMSHPHNRRQSPMKQAFSKVFSSSKSRSRETDETWSANEMPYLAPWVDNERTLSNNSKNAQQNYDSCTQFPRAHIRD